MTGELLLVWPKTWNEIWLRLSKSAAAPVDLFVVLVTDLASVPQQPAPPPPPPPNAFNAGGEVVDAASIEMRNEYDQALLNYTQYRSSYETALNSEKAAKAFFRELMHEVATEPAAVEFLESTYRILASYGDIRLTKRFRDLVSDFVAGFNLRYEIRGQFALHATMSGLFTKLISELKKVARADAHLDALFSEFEEAFADLKADRTQARMKTCLQKQFNMLEALGRRCPNVTAATLGAICDQLDWPHDKIKEVGKNLYRFGSDYPGVRHGGTPGNALRNLEMRDFISLSLMLASFTPYVTNGLDSDRCYSG